MNRRSIGGSPTQLLETGNQVYHPVRGQKEHGQDRGDGIQTAQPYRCQGHCRRDPMGGLGGGELDPQNFLRGARQDPVFDQGFKGPGGAENATGGRG